MKSDLLQYSTRRCRVIRSVTSAIALVLFLIASNSALAFKKAPYPEVKVEVVEPFVTDEAFRAMRSTFANAVAKRDSAGLFSLVGPTFLWTTQEGPNDQFDMGRSALDNFKVVFGFRAADADTDGNVENGPFWETLAAFVAEDSFYTVEDAGNLVCSPTSASVTDEDIYEKAKSVIGAEDDPPEWYFTLRATSVEKSPTDKSEVAKIGTLALPILSSDPKEGAPAHLEVLLPSGKSGWISARTARPLESERLCFAKTPMGNWKIVQYDQLPQEDQ